MMIVKMYNVQEYNTIGNWLMNCDGLKISISKSTCFFANDPPMVRIVYLLIIIDYQSELKRVELYLSLFKKMICAVCKSNVKPGYLSGFFFT